MNRWRGNPPGGQMKEYISRTRGSLGISLSSVIWAPKFRIACAESVREKLIFQKTTEFSFSRPSEVTRCCSFCKFLTLGGCFCVRLRQGMLQKMLTTSGFSLICKSCTKCCIHRPFTSNSTAATAWGWRFGIFWFRTRVDG